MFSHPRYHGPNGEAWDRRNDVGWEARTLTRALDAMDHCPDWRGTGWRPRKRNPWIWRSQPRWFVKAPPGRPIPRTPEPARRRPSFYGYAAREGSWQPYPPRPSPTDWRPRVLLRRGPPVAVIRVPRRYHRDLWGKRGPRGVTPRGPLRGGPERSTHDPQRKPLGRLCGGPERSAKEPQTPPKISHVKTNRGRARKGERDKRPMVVTVDDKGRERKWGPLSRATAWKAGSYWEELGEVKVFFEVNGEKTEMDVEKLVGKGGPRFWFKEKPEPPQQAPEGEGGDETVTEDVVDESTTEDLDSEMSEVDPEETEMGHKMWLVEKITALEKENGELKRVLQEMETRIATLENIPRQVDERFVRIEAAITRIAEILEQQNNAIEGSKSLMISLAEEVTTHRDNFQKVAMVMQVHEQHIVQSGTMTQEMAQYINALVQDNEQKSLLIGSLMRECQAQTEVLRQHHLGQQVIAEMIKRIMAGQQQPQPQQQPQTQVVTVSGPTVTVVDEDDDEGRLDFFGGPNPHKGPPNGGSWQVSTKPPRTRKHKTKPKRK